MSLKETQIIETIVPPRIPDFWMIGGQKKWKWGIENHDPDGSWSSDPEKIKLELYLSKHQQGEFQFGGHELWKEIKELPWPKRPPNMNFMHYLIANPRRIPDSWKSEAVFFWGTILRHPFAGDLCVPFLYFDEGHDENHGHEPGHGHWCCFYYFLNNRFGVKHPAAIITGTSGE